MKKYFKSGDIIILIISILIIFAFFAFTFKSLINVNEGNIKILYKGEEIDTLKCSDVFDEKVNIIYRIEYKTEDKKLYIYKNDGLFKEMNGINSEDFNNTILIKDGIIKMIEASCRHKDCMHMEISKTRYLPIICTNGISVKVDNNSNDIDIIS